MNLLLITLDTTRADHLGCYGSKSGATPNLDAIARGGTFFENALSPAPLTLPSHCTIMTGRTPRHHGVRDNAVFRLGDTFPTLASILRSHGYATAAAVSAAVLDRRTGIARGFDTYGDQVRIRARSEFNYEERAAAQVTDEAIARISKLRRPFFLWVHYYDPHYPYVPPPPFKDRFRSSPYDGEIAYADSQIGRLLGALARAGAEHSTLVVIAGDHGEGLGEHGEDRHDIFVYQATQHVPLIFKGPGIPAGKRIQDNVGLVDIFPTVLGLLAPRIPAPSGIDGVSLLSMMTERRRAGGQPGSFGRGAWSASTASAILASASRTLGTSYAATVGPGPITSSDVPAPSTGDPSFVASLPGGRTFASTLSSVAVASPGPAVSFIAPALPRLASTSAAGRSTTTPVSLDPAVEAPVEVRADASARVFEMESFFPAYSYNWSPPLALISGRWKYISAPRPELYDLVTDPQESRNLLEGKASAGKAAAGLKALAGAGLEPASSGPGKRGADSTAGSGPPQPLAPASGTLSAPTRDIDPVAIASRLAAELRSRYTDDRPARDFGAPVCVKAIEPSCPDRDVTARPTRDSRTPPSPAASGAPASGGAEDSEQRERLASLGYVGGSVDPGSPPPPGPHIDPKDGIATVRDLDRARAWLQTGKASQAAALLEPIARREPRNFPVLATLGAASVEAGAFDRAIEVHKATMALRPDYELPHSNLAGALRAKAASLDGASPGSPGNGPPNAQAAALRDEAVKEYEEALRLDRRDSESYLGYAQLELERSRPGAAREVLRRADVAEAGDPEIYILLGRVEASLGNGSAARKALEESLALDERSAAAHEALGHLDYEAGNARSAATHYARALELSPTPELAKTLGAIRLHALDDRPGARAAFRRALELAPNAPDAREIVEILKELEDRN